MPSFLKGSSKYQVKTEFSDIIHFKHWLLTVCTYTGENHPKEPRFQLNLKLFYLRIWWPKNSFNYGHSNRRDSGYFFFSQHKITFSRFSQNSLVIHPFEHRCQWLLGGSWERTLRDPSCPFLALACLSSVLAISCCSLSGGWSSLFRQRQLAQGILHWGNHPQGHLHSLFPSW